MLVDPDNDNNVALPTSIACQAILDRIQAAGMNAVPYVDESLAMVVASI